jgi:hypothetical protein
MGRVECSVVSKKYRVWRESNYLFVGVAVDSHIMFMFIFLKLQTMQASDGNSATASLLADFLPVWDTLQALEAKYGEDEFGMKYNPLPAAMKSAFGEMGVVEFVVSEGDAVDLRKMKVVEKEASDVAVDKVLRSVAAGLELDGNMVRKAQCVASSGPAATAAEEAAEEEAPVAEDDEATKE